MSLSFYHETNLYFNFTRIMELYREARILGHRYKRYNCPEIDISVSKLLGFETFANFLRDSVSEALVLEKSIRFGLKKKKSRFRKIWSRKKVSVLVLENVVSEKSLGFGKILPRKRKNPNNKNSDRSDVPNLGLGPDWD